MTLPFHSLGDGAHTVIVLHGWFGDAHVCASIEPLLDGDRFRFLFMDWAGYGARRSERGDFSIERVAHDVLALADAQQLGRFSLMGHSMGGRAIEWVAGLAPQRVRGLVAVAPVPAEGVDYAPSTRARLQAAAQDVALRQAIIDRSTGGRLPERWLQAKAARSWAGCTTEAFAAYLPAWADPAPRLPPAGVAPLCIVLGAHDPVFDSALMQRTWLRRHPQAELHVLSGAGHYPMDECPLELVAVMQAFLRKAA
ncbi:MAG: Esterase YbfF [Stenotrophomonas maltophilia]|uniref:Esterase YbfF n=1 Tax=Stenotrophomonas maltophilia TaxID=40324 RepID=A0A7V8FJ68_STEMA|nr:MAG: Esterase YbfF [Stenotrophomonas maltophilia]